MTDVSALPVRLCQFRFRCGAKWGDLALTEVDIIRFCHECGKEVVLCTTRTELVAAMEQRRCVAIDIAPVDLGKLELVPAPPDQPIELMTRLIGEVG